MVSRSWRDGWNVLMLVKWYKISVLRLINSKTNVGEGSDTPLQYSCLENPMDGGAWKAAVHGVAEGWTWLSDFTFTFYFHALEKEMAPHSSTLAWKTPWMEEPRRLQSMGSHRVRHNWSDLAVAAAAVSQMDVSSMHQISDISLGCELGQPEET